MGDTGLYGFAFRLTPNWDTTPGRSYVIAQTIANFKDSPLNTCKDNWIPSMMLWVEGNQLKVRRKGSNMCGTNPVGNGKWKDGYDYEKY